jgi:hypothetical protein
LSDGSYLSNLDGLPVRIIEADLAITGADGSRVGDRYRLITTLLDHHAYPAAALVGLYHERWEIESAYLALRHTLLTGHVLRSQDRPGLEQEIWALLTVYQLLRTAMVDAVETHPGTDPDRASFTTALQAARDCQPRRAYGPTREPQPPTRRHRITEIMNTDPSRGWTGQELATRLQVKPPNLLTQLAEWTRAGFLTRTSAGTYALATPP